jgi:ribonuclease HII
MRSRKFLKAEQAALAWDMPGLVAGVDEAGRGPLAGPVVAAAVILDDLNPVRGLADSKTLTALRREKLYDEIRAKALCCSIGEASVDEIDTLNILEATMLAMRRAVDGLRLKPVKVLVDGNRLPRLDVLAEAIVKGDAKVQAISAASILAKVHRDRWCMPNSTSSTRSTGLTATRATAPQSTWRRCARMAPARSTANRSRRSRRC